MAGGGGHVPRLGHLAWGLPMAIWWFSGCVGGFSVNSLFRSWEEGSRGYWVWWGFTWFAGMAAVSLLSCLLGFHNEEAQTRQFAQHTCMSSQFWKPDDYHQGVGRLSVSPLGSQMAVFSPCPRVLLRLCVCALTASLMRIGLGPPFTFITSVKAPSPNKVTF